MVTLLILCIPLTAAVVGFFVLKAVQLGLRWQIQTMKQETPTMEIPNPIQPIVEAKEQKKQENIFNEWFNGAEESR